MALAKRYVDLLGGTIQVESELGHGACFEVRTGVHDGPPAMTGIETFAVDAGADEMQVIIRSTRPASCDRAHATLSGLSSFWNGST